MLFSFRLFIHSESSSNGAVFLNAPAGSEYAIAYERNVEKDTVKSTYQELIDAIIDQHKSTLFSSFVGIKISQEFQHCQVEGIFLSLVCIQFLVKFHNSSIVEGSCFLQDGLLCISICLRSPLCSFHETCNFKDYRTFSLPHEGALEN